MKVELIGLSQGISFTNKKAVNYLDFQKENGELFRLSVPEPVAEELLNIILKDDAPAPAPKPVVAPAPVAPVQQPVAKIGGDDFSDDDATTFGGDDTTTGAEELDEDSVPSM